MSTCVATIKGVVCGRKCKQGDFCGYHVKKPKTNTLQSITLTFYNQTNTFTTDALMILKTTLEHKYTCNLINLNEVLVTFDNRRTECASILVVKQFGKKSLYDELLTIDWDTKMNLRNKVVNRIGKYAMQFDEEEQESNYELGIQRKMRYDHFFELKGVKNELMQLLSLDELKCQAYYYHHYDKINCAAFHTKLPLTVNLHLGDDYNLYYKWFYSSKPISEEITVTLQDQDLYIMNEKAACIDSHLKKTPILKYKN